MSQQSQSGGSPKEILVFNLNLNPEEVGTNRNGESQEQDK